MGDNSGNDGLGAGPLRKPARDPLAIRRQPTAAPLCRFRRPRWGDRGHEDHEAHVTGHRDVRVPDVHRDDVWPRGRRDRPSREASTEEPLTTCTTNIGVMVDPSTSSRASLRHTTPGSTDPGVVWYGGFVSTPCPQKRRSLDQARRCSVTNWITSAREERLSLS